MSSENWETLYPLIPVVILKLIVVSIIYVSHTLHFQASLKLILHNLDYLCIFMSFLNSFPFSTHEYVLYSF